MRRREEVRKGMQYLEEMMDFKILDEFTKEFLYSVYVFIFFLRYGGPDG